MTPQGPNQVLKPARSKQWRPPSEGPSSGEELHIRRALLMEQQAKYTSGEKAHDKDDSDAEVDKFVNSGKMILEAPNRRLRGKQ